MEILASVYWSHLLRDLRSIGLSFHCLRGSTRRDSKRRSCSSRLTEKIAKLNNDAYKRRLAAKFEATSRANDGTTVSPEEYGAYTEEMKDFVAKKQAKMEKYRNDPSLLNNPAEQADYHRMMAQEQK